MEYNYSYSTATDLPPEVGAATAGVMIGFMFLYLVFILALYVYFAICLMKIANKTNTENGWFAWIPILNFVLMLQIAKKPVWWIILMFIPFVNLVIAIIVWMKIAEALGKPGWLGILMLVPVANIILPGYLAFSQNEVSPAAPPQGPAKP